jgi:hypothetical protein
MSGFEFVLVLFAIIIGLGISSILTGWSEQIRARHRMDTYPLQIALSAFLLFFSLTYLWSLWTFSVVAWTFPLYLLVAAPALILALAAYITRVDTSVDSPTARVQYFRNSGPTFLLLALVPVALVAISMAPALRESVPDPPNLVLITLIRVTMILGIASLAWFKSERIHWIGLGLLFLIVVGLSVRITVRVIESPL